MFALTLLYIGKAFRKMYFTSKISMSTDENLQRMKKTGGMGGGDLLFFRDKFLVIPILNSKYMSCLTNAILSNDGNVPYITL